MIPAHSRRKPRKKRTLVSSAVRNDLSVWHYIRDVLNRDYSQATLLLATSLELVERFQQLLMFFLGRRQRVVLKGGQKRVPYQAELRLHIGSLGRHGHDRV